MRKEMPYGQISFQISFRMYRVFLTVPLSLIQLKELEVEGSYLKITDSTS